MIVPYRVSTEVKRVSPILFRLMQGESTVKQFYVISWMPDCLNALAVALIVDSRCHSRVLADRNRWRQSRRKYVYMASWTINIYSCAVRSRNGTNHVSARNGPDSNDSQGKLAHVDLTHIVIFFKSDSYPVPVVGPLWDIIPCQRVTEAE